MKLLLLLAFCACAQVVLGGDKWALLVCGSRGYDNYRHQADIAHSYQLLVKNGLSRDKIVVMMYDDVAFNRRNPFPGELINVPNGENVYKGIQIDYKGRDVTPDNFLAILQGDHEKMRGKGSGKVIMSNSDDHVFVYYADHGNSGFIAFPVGGMLYSNHLLDAINNMHRQNKYKKMVFYIEACYSGSMFINKLNKDIGVFAVTAANDHESSWSCYYDEKRKTSLADSFSIAWMLDSERHGTNHRTLAQQFESVKSSVRLSHVCNFGDTNGMGGMKLSDFQGSSNNQYSTSYANFSLPAETTQIRSWDVKYHSLFKQLEAATTTEERLRLLKEMEFEEKTKQEIESTLKKIAVSLTSQPEYMFAASTKETTLLEDYCYEKSVDTFISKCYKFQDYDYALRDLHMFANLCNAGVSVEDITATIEGVCK